MADRSSSSLASSLTCWRRGTGETPQRGTVILVGEAALCIIRTTRRRPSMEALSIIMVSEVRPGPGLPSPTRASSRARYVIERALFCAQQGGVGAAAPWRAGGRASRSSAARGRDREPAPPAQAPAVFVPRSAGETCLQGESTRCFSLSADLRPNAPSTPSAFFVLAGREWLYWCSRVDGPHPHPRHVQYDPPLYETPPPGCRHGSRGNWHGSMAHAYGVLHACNRGRRARQDAMGGADDSRL